MAIDLNRFIATFFDEAQEHLESIEEMAMALASGRHDPELLNSIFRAAHSIKGGSGTFGFTQLAEATHEMETLFDGLRKGQGQADASTVRVLLDACDAFRAHLARLKAGDRGTDPAMDAARRNLAGYRAEAAPAAARANRRPGSPRPRSRCSSPWRAKDEGEGYGLFGEDPAAATAPADEKFGFFEPLPAAGSAEAARARAEQSSIRVSVEKIDRIVNLVGELVIAQAMMQQSVGIGRQASRTRASPTASPPSIATRATCSRR